MNANVSEPYINDLFQVIEIEVSKNCNLRCPYCPQSVAPDQKSKDIIMPIELYHRIVNMVSDLDFTGRLSFHHYNEPMLRKDLAKLVRYARSKLPKAFFVLYTNGTKLNDKSYNELLNAGIDRFFVTNHNSLTIPEREYQYIRTPGTFYLSGRGGIIKEPDKPYDLPCFALSEMMMVRYDGRVVICHEDAFFNFVIGDINHQTIEEIWFSKTLQSYRRMLIEGKRQDMGNICAKCDNRLHPLPDTAI